MDEPLVSSAAERSAESEGGDRTPRSASSARGRQGARGIWPVLAWIGFVLAAVGAVDLGLTWIPLDFGNMEWEFGTVSQSFNGLPTLTMGLGLWLGAALASGRRFLAMGLAVGFLLLAVGVVAAAVVYGTTVPVALGSAGTGGIQIGLQKAVAKTATQAVLYPLGFVVVGIKGLKMARSSE